MKTLDDYLYYEEKDPDIKIYCGDLTTSWYNKLITRRELWGKKKAINNRKNTSKSVSELVKRIINGWVIQFQKKAGEQGLSGFIKTSGLVQSVVIKNQKGITLTGIHLIMIFQILKSLVESATWLLMAVSKSFTKWRRKEKGFMDAWLHWKKLSNEHIVKEDTSFLVLMRTEREYARFA